MKIKIIYNRLCGLLQKSFKMGCKKDTTSPTYRLIEKFVFIFDTFRL